VNLMQNAAPKIREESFGRGDSNQHAVRAANPS
jgi:hypothetical protein